MGYGEESNNEAKNQQKLAQMVYERVLESQFVIIILKIDSLCEIPFLVLFQLRNYSGI